MSNGGIKQVMRDAMLKHLQTKDGAFTHNNTDGLYSPARWWFNKYDTAQGGYILKTSGDAQTSLDGDKIKITVTLNYEKTPR